VLVAATALTAVAAHLWWPGTAAVATTAGSPHLQIVLPDGDEIANPDLSPVAVSPDGSRIAYAASRDGRSQLFVRTLTDPVPKALAGTEGATSPFFSPDGLWIGFFGGLKVKKVNVGGTAVQTLCDETGARGGTWSGDGYIYFAANNISGLQKVSENGGAPIDVTQLNRGAGEVSHRWPLALPDGKTLLFTIWTGPGPDERQIVRQSLATGERQVLVRGGDRARYLPDGYLTYVRLDGIVAIPWRVSDPPPTTAPVALPETAHMENEGAGIYDVAANGMLVTVAGGAARYVQRLVWVSPGGKIEPLPLPERDYESVWLSPDGAQALVQIREGSMGLWLYDFARRTLTPFATTGGSSQAGAWTPDGKRIIYRGTRSGTRNLYWRAADGTGDEQRLTTGEGSQTPGSISPDGKFLLLNDQGAKSGSGLIMGIRLDGPLPASAQVIVGKGSQNGQFSPDGKWIAYSEIVSNRIEIIVQPFPGPGARKQISTEGGIEPLWSKNGRELFYQSGDQLMGVTIATSPALSVGEPRVIARGRFRPSPNSKTPYDITADGRFLRVQQIEPERPLNRIEVVLNWIAEVKAAVATK
jgi:Tol biopolymer transport system component